MTKTIILLSVALGISVGVLAQASVTKSSLAGYWQGSAIYYPNFFSYSVAKKEMAFPPSMTNWLQGNKSNTAAMKAIENTKEQLPAMLAGMYFNFTENNSFHYVINGVYNEGTYTLDLPTPTPDATATEKELLDFINSYGYEQIIQLTDAEDGDKTNLYVSGAKGAIVLYPKERQMNLSGELVTTSISFAKVNAADAALLKTKTESAKTATANKKTSDKQNAERAAEKKKADEKAALAKKLATDEETNGKVLTTVDKAAIFPSGSSNLLAFLSRNVYRNIATDNGAPVGDYSVTVSYTVNIDGSLSNIVATNDPGYGMAKEAVRVISRSGTWEPAESGGKKVRYRASITIPFHVTED